MTIFEGLLMAHILGDWLLQTEWQATNKGHNWRAMALHVITYHIIVFIVLWFGFALHGFHVIGVIVILAMLHAIIDRRNTVRRLMGLLRISITREDDRLLVMAVDQSLHLLLLGCATILLTHWPSN